MVIASSLAADQRAWLSKLFVEMASCCSLSYYDIYRGNDRNKEYYGYQLRIADPHGAEHHTEIRQMPHSIVGAAECGSYQCVNPRGVKRDCQSKNTR